MINESNPLPFQALPWVFTLQGSQNNIVCVQHSTSQESLSILCHLELEIDAVQCQKDHCIKSLTKLSVSYMRGNRRKQFTGHIGYRQFVKQFTFTLEYLILTTLDFCLSLMDQKCKGQRDDLIKSYIQLILYSIGPLYQRRRKREAQIPFYIKKYKFGQRDGKYLLYKPDHQSLILKTIHMNVGTRTNATKSFLGHHTLHDTYTPARTHNIKNKVYVKKDNI